MRHIEARDTDPDQFALQTACDTPMWPCSAPRQMRSVDKAAWSRVRQAARAVCSATAHRDHTTAQGQLDVVLTKTRRQNQLNRL